MNRWLIVFGMAVLALREGGATEKSAQAFDYFVNNWNVIGLRDYVHGSRLSPNSELWLAGRTPIQVRVGQALMPLSRAQGKQALDGWLPVFTVKADDGPVSYTVKFWAAPLPDAKDWQKAFDWPAEGEDYLNWITVTAVNTSNQPVKAQADVRPPPDLPAPTTVEGQREPAVGARHARHYSWSWTLEPGASATGVARYTFFPGADPAKYDQAGADLWLKRTVDYWRGAMSRAAGIEVPCRKANEALLAAHVCQLIANDHGEVHGGEGFYDGFYIRDGAY